MRMSGREENWTKGPEARAGNSSSSDPWSGGKGTERPQSLEKVTERKTVRSPCIVQSRSDLVEFLHLRKMALAAVVKILLSGEQLPRVQEY